MVGLIYKYTNLLNNKIYIGQTRTSLETRDKKHLSQISDNIYFHRALKKYGRNNFNLEIVEDNIPLDQLDDKEKYWIKYFDSYYKTGKGYNLTLGGQQWGNNNAILTGKLADEIKNKIQNTTLTFSEIGEQYGVSIYCISDINRGRSFYDKTIKYPIRQAPTRSNINADNIDIIIDMLINTELTFNEIAYELNIKEYTVGEINRGNNSWCPSDLSYPIRKPIQKYTYQNILNQEKVLSIIQDLIFSSDTLEQIGKKYGVAKNTIGDISRGVSWKEITHQFVCPIRKNKIQNQNIFIQLKV